MKKMKKNGFKQPEEWFSQAFYDLDTAKAMFQTRRYIYAVFMCHLAVEKALKAVYSLQERKIPPRTHDLVFLAGKASVQPDDEKMSFFESLNGLSVPTRYPDELNKLLRDYKKPRVKKILEATEEVVRCLKKNR